MYNIVENLNRITVTFVGALKDAPSSSFKITKKGVKSAIKKARRYANGIVDIKDQTQHLAVARQVFPGRSKDKVGIKTKYINNKTGCVGVYLERKIDKSGAKIPYAYTAHFSIDNKLKQKRFILSRYNTAEDAFKDAVAFRLLSINLSKSLLK